MSALITNPPPSAHLEALFPTLVDSLKANLDDLGMSSSNETASRILDRGRAWIERRLLPPGAPFKVAVSLVDIFAIKYAIEAIRTREFDRLHLQIADILEPVESE